MVPLADDPAGLRELASELLLDRCDVARQLVGLALLVLDADRRQDVAGTLARSRVTLPDDLHDFGPVAFEAGAARRELVADTGSVDDVQDFRDGGRKVLAAAEGHDRQFREHVMPPASPSCKACSVKRECHPERSEGSPETQGIPRPSASE